MGQHLLTAKSLQAKVSAAMLDAAARSTRVKIRDGDNLMLIARASGASWVLEYRHAGKRSLHTIGPWPLVTLADARQRAQAARLTLLGGTAPAKPPAPVPPPTDTFRDLYKDWLAKQTGSAIYKKNIGRAFDKDVLPAIGDKAPNAIERDDIAKILREIESRGSAVMLRRVRMWLRHVFEYAIDDEKRSITSSPVPEGHLRSYIKPVAGQFPAVTDPAMAKRLMADIDGYGGNVTRLYLKLAAHLYQRPSELRQASWTEFDFAAQLWTIPEDRMKKRREHWVPLSTQVLYLLHELRGVVGDGDLLFPGLKPGEPISDGTALGALKKMGYNGLHCAHGFRAMATTIMTERLRIDYKLLDKQLSHEEQDKVRKAYNRAESWDERVAIMQQWSDWLTQ